MRPIEIRRQLKRLQTAAENPEMENFSIIANWCLSRSIVSNQDFLDVSGSPEVFQTWMSGSAQPPKSVYEWLLLAVRGKLHEIISLQELLNKAIFDPLDYDFAKLLNLAIQHLPISIRQIQDEFSCSRPTVERWLSGQNAPHPNFRPVIYQWLLDCVREAIPDEASPLAQNLEKQFSYAVRKVVDQDQELVLESISSPSASDSNLVSLEFIQALENTGARPELIQKLRNDHLRQISLDIPTLKRAILAVEEFFLGFLAVRPLKKLLKQAQQS